MHGKAISDMVAGKVVVVAVKASKEIPKTALVWALNHVVQPGDCIKLLVVVPPQASIRLISRRSMLMAKAGQIFLGRKAWGLPRFTTDCTPALRKTLSGTMLDQRDDIADSCSQMMFQLRDIYDPEKVKIRVKVVSGSPGGVVASEAKNAESNWVILDKNLKHEKRYCLEELRCNVVVMKQNGPKILRLNLIGLPGNHEVPLSLPLDIDESSKDFESKCDKLDLKGPFVTPASSPEHELSLSTTEVGTSSLSSSDPGTSPSLLFGNFGNQKKEYTFVTEEDQSLCDSDSDTDINKPSPPSKRLYFQPWMDDILSSSGELTKDLVEGLQRSNDAALTSTYKTLLESLSRLGQQPDIGSLNRRFDVNLSRSVRQAISLYENTPPGPPPLCSICRHKGPTFGNPPKWFTYAELELATDGFSPENFLAEGGFGSVYRGVLADGQVVAVKQHKLASSQGDLEFCSEVEVLSCAQHRNVVMFIGFCVEDARRLLVYEYICNGSLDLHLFGRDQNPLDWSARQKIAVGAARGLRYLHEECRVGCIVHRDMRPNNILITHDFEPLVGDFGLARWQPDENVDVETRIIGTFGYLAPEYAQRGHLTEKADVYSFGVVLVELITGRKAIDVNRPKGQQCLSEWARPLLEKHSIPELIDPRLGNCYSETQVHKMVQCASLCIQRDPHSRPRMSQVLRILEGDVVINVTNRGN